MEEHNPSKWYEDIDNYGTRLGQPFRDAANQSDKDAVEFAKLLIQSLVLLHGGALVALPTFISAKLGIDQRRLDDLLICFSAGVVMALFAGVLAFFALGVRHNAYLKLVEAAQHRAAARAAQVRFLTTGLKAFEDIDSNENSAADTLEVEAEPLFRRYNAYRFFGILLVLASLAALIRASYLAANHI